MLEPSSNIQKPASEEQVKLFLATLNVLTEQDQQKIQKQLEVFFKKLQLRTECMRYEKEAAQKNIGVQARLDRAQLIKIILYTKHITDFFPYLLKLKARALQDWQNILDSKEENKGVLGLLALLKRDTCQFEKNQKKWEKQLASHTTLYYKHWTKKIGEELWRSTLLKLSTEITHYFGLHVLSFSRKAFLYVGDFYISAMSRLLGQKKPGFKLENICMLDPLEHQNKLVSAGLKSLGVGFGIAATWYIGIPAAVHMIAVSLIVKNVTGFLHTRVDEQNARLLLPTYVADSPNITSNSVYILCLVLESIYSGDKSRLIDALVGVGGSYAAVTLGQKYLLNHAAESSKGSDPADSKTEFAKNLTQEEQKVLLFFLSQAGRQIEWIVWACRTLLALKEQRTNIIAGIREKGQFDEVRVINKPSFFTRLVSNEAEIVEMQVRDNSGFFNVKCIPEFGKVVCEIGEEGPLLLPSP